MPRVGFASGRAWCVFHVKSPGFMIYNLGRLDSLESSLRLRTQANVCDSTSERSTDSRRSG